VLLAAHPRVHSLRLLPPSSSCIIASLEEKLVQLGTLCVQGPDSVWAGHPPLGSAALDLREATCLGLENPLQRLSQASSL
jgi:hypothetical protein